MDELRGSPMSVGSLEEIIDDNHAIVSTSVGSEHYVSILSFVDKDLLEPGCSVLLNHKVCTLIWHRCFGVPTLDRMGWTALDFRSWDQKMNHI